MQQAQLDTANVSRTSIAIVAVMMVGNTSTQQACKDNC